MTEADTDGTVAALLILTAGAGPGARADGHSEPCRGRNRQHQQKSNK